MRLRMAQAVVGEHLVIATFPAITKVPYDPAKDLAPISRFSTSPHVLGVNPKFPAKTVAVFVAHVKAQPTKLSYAGGGGPGTARNPPDALSSSARSKCRRSYRGTAPAMTDLIAGHIPMMFALTSEVLPQRAAEIPAAPVSSGTRAPQAPDAPTIAEFGFPVSMRVVDRHGAPARTPKAIIDRIAEELARAMKYAAFVEQLDKNGVDPAHPSPAQFSAFIAKEITLWGEAVRTRCHPAVVRGARGPRVVLSIVGRCCGKAGRTGDRLHLQQL